MRRVDPSQGGIGPAALLAQAPGVGTPDARAGALGEREQARPQRIAAQRPDGVEERHQEHRGQSGEHGKDQRKQSAGEQPPVTGGEPHRPVHERRRESTENEGNGE